MAKLAYENFLCVLVSAIYYYNYYYHYYNNYYYTLFC